MNKKICRICNKPFNGKTQCCVSCRTLQKKVSEIVSPSRDPDYIKKPSSGEKKNQNKYSRSSLWYLCNHVIHSYDPKIVIEWFRNHSYDHWTYLPYRHMNIQKKYKENAQKKRKSINNDISSTTNINVDFPYIFIELQKMTHKNKKFIRLTGTIGNPHVYYQCIGCSHCFSISFENLKKNKPTHQCISTLSSGEVYIQSLLDNHAIPYLTQRDTLLCINPKTGAQLPYDFEIINKKIIIEIQGDQHTKFIEYFHKTYENLAL